MLKILFSLKKFMPRGKSDPLVDFPEYQEERFVPKTNSQAAPTRLSPPINLPVQSKSPKHHLNVLFGLAAILLVTSLGYFQRQNTPISPIDRREPLAMAASSSSQPTTEPDLIDMPPLADQPVIQGIIRLAILHTTVPNRPRVDVTQYIVQKGDSIFGIAEKFGIKPETVMWGNQNILHDDPHYLQPGQQLNILPVDGTYYEWQGGENLQKVAEFYKVDYTEIVNWPGNKLDLAIDPADPGIEAGKWLIIPGGVREYISWSPPIITRTDPGVATIMGPGFCGPVYYGAVGAGYFIWPTTEKWISGYDYTPNANHYGIDIAGREGNAVYAADSGVIVYSGWNDWGYGKVLVIDHGNGWQTLYAHLSAIYTGCGLSVDQGAVIGAVGSTGRSTGPHLHFEMMHATYGRVNPHNYLP